MKKTPPIYIQVLFFMVSFATFGQQVKFKPLTTKEGLSNNSVNDFVSDQSGRLWIATWDGLSVYDGEKVIVYKHSLQDSTSIAGNVVLHLLRDNDFNIWALTDSKAISVYKGNDQFTNFYFKEKPQGMFLTKGGKVAIKADNKFQVWLNNKFVEVREDELLVNNKLGVLKQFLLEKYPDLVINDILKDKEGNIWYATRRDGLYIIPNTPDNLNNKRIEHYTYDLYSPYSFTSNEIERLYQDDFDNIWLAHKDGGVSMAYQGAEQVTTIIPHPLKYPHLPNETLRAITKDNSSIMWLGYYTKGLFYFSEKTNCYLHYHFKESETNPDWDRIRSLHTTRDGAVWAGTYAGLIKITANGYTLYKAQDDPNFPANRNYSFYEDENILWVACWGGLAKLDRQTGKFLSFDHQNDLLKYHIRYITKIDDRLAIATEENGVIIFSEQKGIEEFITVDDGILGNSIYSIYFDNHTNYLWLASLGGVSVVDLHKKVIRNITEEDGIPSHMVYSLLPNEEKLWISTTKGIGAINRNTYEIDRLPSDLGWQAEEFSEGSAYQDPKGMLFFGGITGLSYFQPNAFRLFDIPPKLYIKVDNNEIFGKRIEKSYKNNQLSIHIFPVTYSSIQPFIYYKLEGVDSDWKPLQGNEVYYSKLPSGTFTFLTRTGDNQEEMYEHFSIVITPPFYETITFYIMVVLFLGMLIFFYIFQKDKAAKRVQRELEERINRRTATIEQQKQELVKVNTDLEEKNNEINEQQEKLLVLHHQIKNRDFEVSKFKDFTLAEFKPKLSKILNYITVLENNPQKQQMYKEVSGLIQILTEWDYLDQVNDLGEVKKTQIHFKKLIRNIYKQAAIHKIQFSAELNFNVHLGNDIILLDALRYKLFCQYMFSEIIKYTEAGSNLKVETELFENYVITHISSTGHLIMKQWESIEKFSPYYKAFTSILSDLTGTLTVTTEKQFELTAKIPVTVWDQEETSGGIVLLKHLENTNDLQESNILVLCEQDEISFVSQLLENTEYHLIFESNINALGSAMQHISLMAIVLYNQPFSKELFKIAETDQFKKIPTVYIAEAIDMDLQEQALELGLSTIIHLPVNTNFIFKKIKALVKQYESQYQGKIDAAYANLSNREILNPNEKMVKQAMEVIKMELGNPNFNVDMLIGTLEISRTKCYRLFKEVLDQSPSDVIINLRLQKAEQLLLLGHLNISEISFECGFNDPKYFSRMFKKHFAINPKSYKNKRKEPNPF